MGQSLQRSSSQRAGDREEAGLKGLIDLLEAIRIKGAMLGANSVVGLKIDLDPFAEQQGVSGLKLQAEGTAAKLESLF